MARKLLKRKRSISLLKKLKTVNYTKTSLGQWALTHLTKKHGSNNFINYPYKTHSNKFLHRTQLLNAVCGGFSLFSSSNTVFKQTSKNNLHANLLQDNLVKTKSNSKFAPLSALYPVNTEKSQASSLLDHLPVYPHKSKNQVISLQNPPFFSADVLQTENSRKDRVKKKQTADLSWPVYNLKYKTYKRYAVSSTSGNDRGDVLADLRSFTYTNNWKHIYSLDQLMCHQYDGQFRRRISHHKAKLIEKQKLKTLYGTLSKRQKKIDGVHTLSRSFETRLDVACKRVFVFTTLRNAQHWISLGRILVNSKVIKSPSYTLQPGDFLQIDKTHQQQYKTNFLSLFYKFNKESKYVQGARLLSRWKEWATLYNSLSLHQKTVNLTCLRVLKDKVFFKDQRGEKKTGSANAANAASGKEKTRGKGKVLRENRFYEKKGMNTWPDKAIQSFWYLSGRSALNCLSYSDKKQQTQGLIFSFCINLFRELSFQKRSRAIRSLHWKAVYRKRILLFSRWLLSSQPLVRDGLYSLRWHRAFIRKKSGWVRGCHRHLSVQKPLHFETSYKKLCALYLYPPQRIAWPCMINFKNT